MKRSGLILGWTATILVAAFNIFAAVMKLFVAVPAGSPGEAMMQRLGITPSFNQQLGILELIIVVLFLVPRTSTVGFVVMVGYMAGALATNLTHGFTHAEAMPIYITFLLLMLSAYFRNPELLSRLTKKPFLP